MHHLKPPTPFADALALQAVEAFVARVRTRVISERTSFASAVEHELADWREAVPAEVSPQEEHPADKEGPPA